MPATCEAAWEEPANGRPPRAEDGTESVPITSGFVLPSTDGPRALYGATSVRS